MTNGSAVPGGTSKSIDRVIKWLFFSVLIALVPLIAAYLFMLIKGRNPGLDDVAGSGELFLVVIALCGAAIGDLLTSAATKAFTKLLSGGLTLVVLLLASLLYAGVSDATTSRDALDSGWVVTISGALFLMGIVSCGCCIAVSE